MKIAKLVFNSAGITETYGTVQGDKSDQELIKELCDIVPFAEGAEGEFERDDEYEKEGVPVVNYTYDGMGILIGANEEQVDEVIAYGDTIL